MHEDEKTQELVIKLFKNKMDVDVTPVNLDYVHRLGPFDKNSKYLKTVVNNNNI